MQGNASWLSGFLFSISCFQGWSLWTELLCSTSLGSVQCQCSGTSVTTKQTQEKHGKPWAECEFALHKGPSSTFHGLSQMESLLLCVLLHCPELRAVDVCQLCISNTAAPVNCLHLCWHPSPSESCRAAALSLEEGSAPPAMQCLCSWHCLFHEYLLHMGILVSAFPAPSNQPSPRSSCLGQKPGFWVRKINLNGCSSEFNDPC